MTARERAEAIPATRFTFRDVWIDAVEQAINAAVEEEREACAKIAYEKSDRVQSANHFGWGMRSIADSIGTAIRARCNTFATESLNRE